MEKCVFDHKGVQCVALTKRECVNCKFRKTASQLMEGRIKSMQRLITTEDGAKRYLKYYG